MDLTAWAIALLILGLLLLVLEFFIPSAGILAVLCALCLLTAIILGFMAGPIVGLSMIIATSVLVPAAAMAAVRWWPDTPFGKLMLIERPKSSDEVLPETFGYRGLKSLVGLRGQAKGLMLPSGIVVIDGKTYDAVSEGTAIEPGSPIIVVAVSTQRLVVRPDHSLAAELAGETGGQNPPARDAKPLIDDIPDPFAE